MISRRDVIVGACTVLAGSTAATPLLKSTSRAAALGPVPTPIMPGRTIPLKLDIGGREVGLPCFGGRKLPLLTYGHEQFPLIVRCRLGDTIAAEVTNHLRPPGEPVTIHWHGLRVGNGDDGVPYITQTPIEPQQTGRYSFSPPDTGTYFFHTHCNSVEHFGRGLVGVLIVEGDESTPFAADLPLMMLDWRLGAEGGFQAFTTDAGAAKGGTAGTIRSINGMSAPRYDVPAAQTVRLRVLNVDATRLSDIGIEGAAAHVIAIDGNACEPFALKSWRMGPAMRADLAVEVPRPSQSFQLVDYFAAAPVTLATFTATGHNSMQQPRQPAALRRPRIAEPDIAAARRMTFDFSATASGRAVADLAVDGVPIGPLCLSKKTFWAINKQSWSNMDHAMSGPPLAELAAGQTYIFELINRTPRMHPIHIHGHTFKWLKSNIRTLPSHYADTVLLLPKERVEVAFVADNIGDWMFHCHVLEHQETGMMGYLRVL